ncbi:MAG: hypothetical protein AAF357_11735 [Verrucomicrobiota bacterium]
MNQGEIEERGKYEEDSEWFDGKLDSPLFGQELGLRILREEGKDRISDKQIRIVNDFLDLKKAWIPHIKTLLFSHFEECVGCYEEGEFDEIKNPDDAFREAKLDYLLIWETDAWKGRAANICFDVEWEMEHGISVVLYDGVLKGAHEISHYYFEYEKR